MELQHKLSFRKKDGGIQMIANYKDADGKWRQKSKQGFKTEREAKKHAYQLLEEIHEAVSLKTPEEFSGITVGEFKRVFLDEMTRRKVEFGTMQNFRTIFKRIEHLDNLKVSDVNTMQLQKVVHEMNETLAPATARKYFVQMKQFFKFSVRPCKIIRENPMDDIPTPKGTSPKRRALTVDELDELLEKILSLYHETGNPRHYSVYLMCHFGGYAGMRIGEIVALTRPDIDLEKRTISITKQLKVLHNGKCGLGLPKNGKARTAHYPSKIDAAMKSACNQDITDITQRLFPKEKNKAISAYLSKLFKCVGYNDITFHNLRHTYGTNLVAAGIDPATAAAMIGDTVEVFLRTYVHVHEDMTKKALEKVENYF